MTRQVRSLWAGLGLVAVVLLFLMTGAILQHQANSETAATAPAPAIARYPTSSFQGEVLDAVTGQSIPDAAVFLDGHEMARGAFRGYTFNYYHWPWITAELPPEDSRLA